MIRGWLVGMLFIFGTGLYGQSAAWELFEKAKFKDEYIEEYFSYATLLENDKYSQSLNGKEISIGGHYIPVMDEDIIILSKYAYANCFFLWRGWIRKCYRSANERKATKNI